MIEGADRRQHLQHPFDALGALSLGNAGGPHAERENLRNREARKDASAFRHHRHTVRRQGTRQVARQQLAVDQNATGLGFCQPEQGAQQRALAGAIVTNEAKHLPRPELDADVEQHRLAAVADAQVLGLEHRGCHTARSPK